MVKCRKCGEEKLEAEFYNAAKDRRCKVCSRARARAYAAAHVGKRVEYNRKWIAANRAKAAGYQREWRKKNPGESREIWTKSQRKHARKYRTVAETMLGRALERGEHVHHVNCVNSDNRPENLFVCSRNAHARAHGSLWRLVKSLMEAGHVLFDRGTGVYRLGTPG